MFDSSPPRMRPIWPIASRQNRENSPCPARLRRYRCSVRIWAFDVGGWGEEPSRAAEVAEISIHSGGCADALKFRGGHEQAREVETERFDLTVALALIDLP